MSTDTIEEVETIPMTDSVEVGGDLEAAVVEEHEIALVQDKGMVGIAHPIPGSEDADIRIAIDLKMRELFAEQARGRKLQAEEQKTKRIHTDAKKAYEVQVERIQECIDDLEVAYRNEPDPAKFPLFDKAKADINAEFPAPEGTIQPLPAQDFAEYLRRKQNETPVAEMGLKKNTLKTLAELKLDTAGAIVRKFNAVTEAGAKFTSITGMIEAKLEDIADALKALTDAAEVEWNGFADGRAVDAGEEDF